MASARVSLASRPRNAVIIKTLAALRGLALPLDCRFSAHGGATFYDLESPYTRPA